MDFHRFIINKNENKSFITAIVSSVSPLKIKLYSDDSEFGCKATSNLIGLKVGSNVICQKIGSQFVITGVIAQSDLDKSSDIIVDLDAIKVDIQNLESNVSTNSDALTVLGWYRSRYVKKSNDTSRNNTSSSTADPHLTFSSFPATGTYEIEAVLYVTYSSSPTSGFFACKWYLNGGIAQLTRVNSIGVDQTGEHYVQFGAYNLTTAITYGGMTSYIYSIRQKFLVTITASSTLTLYWCQNSAESIDTTLNSSSYMKITKLFS